MARFDDQATTSSTEVPAAEERLELAELAARPLRVAPSPLPTLLAVLDAARGRGGGVPSEWVSAARSALSVGDLRALDPVVIRPHGFVPDCLVPLPDAGSTDGFEELGRIARLDGEAVLAELTGVGGPGLIGPWTEVAREPKAWVRRYARTVGRTWKALEGELTAARALIDREIERIGAAIARGAVAEAVGDLHPAGAVRDGAWTLPGEAPGRRRLGERGLVLIPKLTGRRSPAIRAYDGDALTHLAYPLPGATRLLGDMPPPSSLEALLGAQRTTILRRLDHPQTVGRLAEWLIAVPSAATHHTGALETAGLVVRERQGRHVLVRRTARGTALLNLYDRA